ncbi:hypothetical protein B0H14DRAFT_3424804 [Mycena olivaceomarginata]|nr:hypothetical protein B0H14DRAFT_3424804 [Mycena olivaceomarginata]
MRTPTKRQILEEDSILPSPMYIPTINTDSDEDIAPEILEKPHKPAPKTSAAGASGPQVPIKPRPKSKKMDSTGSMSGDEGSLDLQAERPLIISHDGNDDLLDFSDGHIPPVPHRHRSSSSIGSMGAPPDTDHDHDYDYDVKTSSVVDDLDEEEEEEEEHRPVMQKATKKKTAQQMKYEQEQPAVRSSRVIHAKAGSVKPKVSPESDWHLSTRIVFPATGGAIKLLEQNPLLKGVLKDSMALTVHDLAFVDFFPLMVSRESHASRTLRRVAREDQKTFQIQYRAKKDTKFCQRLGPLLFTRAGNVRTGLRNLSISTAATHYELNKTGLTASHIRSIVKQLITDQQYIFPFAASATTFVTADVPITKPAKVAALKAFATDQPFQAPLIVDLIHETWWKGPKALGFKYIKELKSHRVDRPSEVGLPDPMVCAAGAYTWASLLTRQTGHYVPTPEFSQELLESTYKALEDFIKQQRDGKSSKSFNKAMHDLYLRVSRSQSATVTSSGSANNVVTLAIDSD